jgi:chaperonin GroEL
MAQEIIYGSRARSRIMGGIDKLADTVSITMGPRGRNVLIEHRTSGLLPVLTRDGMTVIEYLLFGDRIEDLGIHLIRQMAREMSKSVGDGTSTSVALMRSIAREASRGMAAGLNSRDLRIGIELATRAVIDELAIIARPCRDEASVKRIAALAAHDAEEIGVLISDAIDKAGTSGTVVIELGSGRADEIELVSGVKWEQGYRSPYFVTDRDRHVAELTNPLVLIYDRRIEEFAELIPVLELARKQQRSLLIAAEDIAEAALPGILLNHIRGNLHAVAVRSPGHGDNRYERLIDLAVLTGGRAILEAEGSSLATVTPADLGSAAKVTVTEDFTTLVGGGGDAALIEDRAASVRHQIEQRRNADPTRGSPKGALAEMEVLKERLGALIGRVAYVKIGGGSDVEIKERLQRAENAYNSATAAMAEGIVPGGGVALARCTRALDRLRGENIGQDRGIAIVKTALREPISRISANAGYNAAEVFFNVTRSTNPNWCFDARTGEYGDAYELGLIDPVRVTRLAILKAASTAGMLLTTDCVVSDVVPDDPTFGFTPEWAAATREDPRR